LPHHQKPTSVGAMSADARTRTCQKRGAFRDAPETVIPVWQAGWLSTWVHPVDRPAACGI